MVVVAARRDECGTRAITLRQFEAEHAAVERQRPIQIGNLQVYMADPGAGMDRLFCEIAAGGLCHASPVTGGDDPRCRPLRSLKSTHADAAPRSMFAALGPQGNEGEPDPEAIEDDSAE